MKQKLNYDRGAQNKNIRKPIKTKINMKLLKTQSGNKHTSKTITNN